MREPPLPEAESETAAPGLRVSDSRGSFRGIFKASALIGSSALINAVFGAVRAKVLAALLGPAGIGLMGAFTVILEFGLDIAQLGLTQSGVRQIAEAASTGDERRLGLTALVLRRATLLSAIIGAVALWVTSGAVSQLTFGTREHAASVSLLAVALFLTVVSHAQGAVLQGTRRTKDVAKLHISAAFLGSISSVSIVYLAAERGIVPSMVAAATTSILLSWWFSRKVRTIEVVPTEREVAREARIMLKLGLAFLASGLLMSGTAFLVRTFVIRTLGLEAAGIYQAAWTLGGLYVGFVLNALGMDFYPRLVGVINDHYACNKLVNEQTVMSIIMAAPGIIATITFAPFVIYVFYSAKFEGAIILLRLIALGMTIRIITYPVRFIIIAKNRQLAFFAVEAAWAILNIGTTWWGLKAFGLEGAGIAFLVTNLIQGLIVYQMARGMTDFHWSRENVRACTNFLLACSVTFITQIAFPRWPAMAIGTILTTASLWYCLRTIASLTGAEEQFPRIRGILRLGGRN